MQSKQPMNAAQRRILVVSLLVIFVVAVLFVVLDGGTPRAPRPTASPEPTFTTVQDAISNLPTPTLPPTMVPLPSNPPPPTETPGPTPLPAPQNLVTIKRKDTGEAVVYLQKKLIELGYLAEGSADGDFGSGTESAVKEFQRKNDIKVDGIAGPATQTAMYGPGAVRK